MSTVRRHPTGVLALSIIIFSWEYTGKWFKLSLDREKHG